MMDQRSLRKPFTWILWLAAIPLALLSLDSCYTPGPLKADRDPDDLFAPSEASIVVDAILLVDAPLPYVFLRRTAAPGDPYTPQSVALAGARVSISQGEAVHEYRADPVVAGRYVPTDPETLVMPSTSYELSVMSEGDPAVRAVTNTPPRIRIAQLVLFDLDENGEQVELGRLGLFGDLGNDVYVAPENQLEHAIGFLEIRLAIEGETLGAASYQFGIRNLERASPLLYSLFDEDDEEKPDREASSPLMRMEDDELFLSWEGISYAGRHTGKVFAVDENWFDLVRTDNVDSDRNSGEAGQSFQRPLFHVENGIGLFASAAVDSFGFFVRAKDTPPCPWTVEPCECWGCGDRNAWSGILDRDTGRGRIRYDRDVGTGSTCELSYEIDGATPVEACSACDFAWELELGKKTVYRDRGACGEAEGLRGKVMRLGHASDAVSTEGGTPRHGLFVESDGLWWPFETGWSLLLPTTSDRRWLFGFSDEDAED
ncbi:MAG: hypothetical protein VX733_01360 [Candidatus Latescibacterota bacterium]|nr:hypothetical protein [Candidatus Latescibacterota bacterium]